MQAQKYTYKIPAMDCPAEEALLRTAFRSDEDQIVNLRFDLPHRLLSIVSPLSPDQLSLLISSSGFDATLLRVECPSDAELTPDAPIDQKKQRRALIIVLLINAAFFVGELTFGILSQSMGLTADSLDMLADALVYGMSLMVVGHQLARQKRVALWSGILQMALATIGIYELVRRFVTPDQEPHSLTMMIVAATALAANVSCLYILRQVERTTTKDATPSPIPISCASSCPTSLTATSSTCSPPSCSCSTAAQATPPIQAKRTTTPNNPHLKASIIFSANDVIINAGVIFAGLLVHLLDSALPDLIIGSIVFLLVLHGAFRILRLART